MGIVHDAHCALRRKHLLKAAFGSRKLREHLQHCFLLLAEQGSHAKSAQQVVGIEAANEPAPSLPPIKLHQQALQGIVQHLPLEMCHLAQGEVIHLGGSILHHYAAALVVYIYQGKSTCG